MSGRDRYAPMFGRPVADWHKWFAWRPVETVDRGKVWLRVVNRRRVHKLYLLPGGADWWFQHAVDIR